MIEDSSPQGAAAVDEPKGSGKSVECDCPETQGLFPKRSAAGQPNGLMPFLFVLICYAIVDYGRLRWLPFGPDVGHHWEVFYASYVELVFHNDLAHWFPYGLYGQPNTIYSLMDVTSTNYLMMAIGKMFHVKNAVLLFQLSLMADHLLFLFGIYLLARSFFRRQSAIWLCAIGSITLLHGYQLPFPQAFRMVAWYPLILYFLVWFFRDHRAEGIWIAGVVFVFSCLGNSYEQPYVLLGILPFLVAGSLKHPEAWRCVFRCGWRNLASMALFATAALLFLCMADRILEGIIPVRPERADLSGIVSVEEYSGRGNHAFPDLLISLFAGHLFYIGLLPLACLLWGLFRLRTPLFKTLMASALLVAWFSIGGLFSLLFYYYVPFFSYLHHIYLSLQLVPVLLLLASGAAWDLLELSWKVLKVWLAFPVIIFFSIDFCLYCDAFPLAPKNVESFFSSCRWAFIKLAIYGGLLALAGILWLVLRSAAHRLSQRWQGLVLFRALATAALLIGLSVDVFQYSYNSGLPANEARLSYRDAPVTLWQPVSKSSPAYQACYVHPMTWQGQRLEEPETERKHVAIQSPSYFYTYAFAQFDPCQPKLPPRTIAKVMQKLLALREKDDPALRTILGCDVPKLRLVTQALYVNNEADAATAVRNRGDLADVAILQWPNGAPQPPMSSSPAAASPGSVEVTDFGANGIWLRASVTIPSGAWLVYADAYDPRWRAWVNGRPVPIVPAYVGLKAVWVPYGESSVRMKFSAWSNVGIRLLAIGSALCSLSLLLFCGLCIVRGFRMSQRKDSFALLKN